MADYTDYSVKAMIEEIKKYPVPVLPIVAEYINKRYKPVKRKTTKRKRK